MSEPRTLDELFTTLARSPWTIVRRWNYKAAILSSVVRASIFFSVNLTAGLDAAWAAAGAELVLRFATSGFYGALTQTFRRVEPRWVATACAMVLLPSLAHSIEFLVHWTRGTPALAFSIGASVVFTMFSTAFNLFAMRHGALVVGEGHSSLLDDMIAMPRLLTSFILGAARSVARACL